MIKKKKLRRRLRLTLRRRRMSLARGVTILPHLFTLGNAFFGFISIIFAARGAWLAAANCILIGALMDALDGRIARFFNAESPLGVELDSMCDVISFCLAPALLIYFSFLYALGPLGIMACAFYVLAGVFRLARFNLIADQQTIYFLGLPTTAAACFLVAVLLNMRSVDLSIGIVFGMFFLMLFLAFLMASSISFPAFKQGAFRFKKKHLKIAIVVGFAFIVTFKLRRILLAAFILYLAWAVVLAISKRFKKQEMQESRV